MSEGGEARSGKHPESVRTGEGETFGERAERLGGEARNHAEREAVARALRDVFDGPSNAIDWAVLADAAIAAVRSSGSAAQNHEGRWVCDRCGGPIVPGYHCKTSDGGRPILRSPQGEGHEGSLRRDLLIANGNANRLRAVIADLADKHHRTVVNSKLHDPENQEWDACACHTCKAAKEAVDAWSVPPPERDQHARLVAGIQWVRGMCSDEEPYEVIDARLAELLDEASYSDERGRLLDRIGELAGAEAERDAYKAALEGIVALDSPDYYTGVERAADIARSVLAGGSSTTEE